MGNRPVKLVNGIYRQRQSSRSRHRNTQQQPLLKEEELVLVSSSSDSLKRYQRKLPSSEGEYNADRTDRSNK